MGKGDEMGRWRGRGDKDGGSRREREEFGNEGGEDVVQMDLDDSDSSEEREGGEGREDREDGEDREGPDWHDVGGFVLGQVQAAVVREYGLPLDENTLKGMCE